MLQSELFFIDFFQVKIKKQYSGHLEFSAYLPLQLNVPPSILRQGHKLIIITHEFKVTVPRVVG